MSKAKILMLDTLYERKVGPGGSSFRTNQAGEELSKCDASAIPLIEDLILQEIVPSVERLGDFGGLDYLLGSYLVIGVREGCSRIFDFLKSLPDEIIREAVGCCSTFFYKTDKGFNFGVAPSQAIVDFLRDIESSGSGATQGLAREVREEVEASCRL